MLNGLDFVTATLPPFCASFLFSSLLVKTFSNNNKANPDNVKFAIHLSNILIFNIYVYLYKYMMVCVYMCVILYIHIRMYIHIYITKLVNLSQIVVLDTILLRTLLDFNIFHF